MAKRARDGAGDHCLSGTRCPSRKAAMLVCVPCDCFMTTTGLDPYLEEKRATTRARCSSGAAQNHARRPSCCSRKSAYVKDDLRASTEISTQGAAQSCPAGRVCPNVAAVAARTNFARARLFPYERRTTDSRSETRQSLLRPDRETFRRADFAPARALVSVRRVRTTGQRAGPGSGVSSRNARPPPDCAPARKLEEGESLPGPQR